MVKKSEAILAAICGLFVGIVIGFLISPIKKGVEIGNLTNSNNSYGDSEEAEEEEEAEE